MVFFKLKNGFTLAETLITLTILGVVATVVIPNIIKNYQKRMTITRLKMAYSMLDSLTQQSYIENGYPPIETFSEQDFNNYFGKYLNIVKYCALGHRDSDPKGCFRRGTYKTSLGGEIAKDNNGNELKRDMWTDLDGDSYFNGGYGPNSTYKVILQNGMSLGIANNYARVFAYAIVVDIDGPNKGDSKLGQDVFQFSYSAPAIMSYMKEHDERYKDRTGCPHAGIFLYPYTPGQNSCEVTRAQMIDYCKKNGSYGSHGMRNGSSCAGLIIKDGWKISSDYPWDYAHKKS